MRTACKLISRTTDESGDVVWPVSAAEVRENAQIPHEYDDAALLSVTTGETGIIPAATAYIEDRAGVALVTQTRRLTFDGYRTSYRDIELRYPPVQSVTSVKYLDTDYAETTVDAAEYRVLTDEEPGRIRRKNDTTWMDSLIDDAANVWVDFVCGYGDDGSAVPAKWKWPLLVLTTYWLNNRMAFAGGEMDARFAKRLDALISNAGAQIRYV